MKLPSTRKILNWNTVLSVIFAAGLIGMGGKILTFCYQSSIGYVHYFPWFPNILDSIFIFLAATYLCYRSLKLMVDEVK